METFMKKQAQNRPGVRKVMPYNPGMQGVVTVQYPDDLGVGTYRDDKVWGSFYLRGDIDIVATRRSDGKKIVVTPTTAGANWKTLIKRLGDLPILTSDPSKAFVKPSVTQTAPAKPSGETSGTYHKPEVSFGEPQVGTTGDKQQMVEPKPMKYQMQPVEYDPVTGLPKPPELKMIKENSKISDELKNIFSTKSGIVSR
jgi:hypothetical protein